MAIRAADQWAVQATVQRIVAELQARHYLVWFDRELRQELLSVAAPFAISAMSTPAAFHFPFRTLGVTVRMPDDVREQSKA
jgi:hypothetical protein